MELIYSRPHNNRQETMNVVYRYHVATTMKSANRRNFLKECCEIGKALQFSVLKVVTLNLKEFFQTFERHKKVWHDTISLIL